ncbi:MarR family transcriptional regulator [Paenibacillus sp. 598K]|uniref:MarR family winged helix-turn-helix transcriptional regulator n=1 Tax=Paenibacillus sp. 598K TaxID=1117987 RepID=UPI000FF978BE|nr:MarR family transcriptional regulator [Paenibacillus sp. 598K]GBF74924.1 MarR family transcriptional regulator [Paenibacillus sp. 598K]
MELYSNHRREIILQIYRASLLLDKSGRELVSRQGLSSRQQWLLLGILYFEGEQSLRDLASHMLVSKQNITGMVQRLQSGGYVETAEDERDRRVTRVTITERGREVYDALVRSGREQGRDIFRNFDCAELTELLRLMNRLVGDLMDRTDRTITGREEENRYYGH